MSYGIPINEVMLKGKHFEYLVLQRGKIHALRDDRIRWAGEYRQSLLADYVSIQKALPGVCKRFIDVGGGLSGLGIMVTRYYNWGRGNTESWILDGKDDPAGDPNLERDHDITFSNEEVARDFWKLNNVTLNKYVDAHDPKIPEDVRFDLILSTASWCFHYEPDTYLDLLTERSHSGTAMILDVRNTKNTWIKQLEKYWRLDHVLLKAPKYTRGVWRRWRLTK